MIAIVLLRNNSAVVLRNCNKRSMRSQTGVTGNEIIKKQV